MPPKRKRKRPVTPAQGAAGPSGSGQQEDEGQGQGEQEVIAERRQVIKAAFRALVEAAQPDLSPAQVDAVVAQVNQRMTMGSMQCCLASVMSLTMLLQSFLGQPTPGFPAAGPAPCPPPPPDPACPPYSHPRLPTRRSPRSAAPPAQLPPPVQLDIEDPNLLPQIKAAMDLLTNASVQEHMMRGPHHRGIRLLPGEVATFEQLSSAWPVAKLQQLDQAHMQGDGNSLNANATKIITSITEYCRHPQRFISWWAKAVGVVGGGFSKEAQKHFPKLVLEWEAGVESIGKGGAGWLPMENRVRYVLFLNRSLEAWQTAPHANSRRPRTCPRPFTMLPMVGVRARHFVIDDRVLLGLLADLGQGTLTRARFEADSLPHWQRFIQYSQLQNSGWEFARRVETDGVSVSVHFVRSQAVHEPVELPFIGRKLTATSDYSPATHIVGVDPGVTQAIKAAHAKRDPATGQVLRQWEWELTKGQLKHDSGLTKAKQDTAHWSAAIQPQLQQLAASTPTGTTLDGLHAHILDLKATWDPLWEEYLKPRWRRQRLALHHAQERVIEGFCKKVVNGMKWVSRQHYHQERGVAVFLGAGNFSQGGWKAGAVRAGFRKVVEQPSRPSTDPRPDRLVIVDEFRTSRVSSSVHARQPCELHLPPNQPRPVDWVPPAGQVNHRLLRPAWSLRHAKCVRGLKWCHEDQPPAQPPPGPVIRPQAPPWGRWLDRDTNPCLNFQRIGESKHRPLELCRWDDLEALPPIGKEYHQRYKLVNDRLPKVKQRLHRAAEYRRGIDGRARNNADAPAQTAIVAKPRHQGVVAAGEAHAQVVPHQGQMGGELLLNEYAATCDEVRARIDMAPYVSITCWSQLSRIKVHIEEAMELGRGSWLLPSLELGRGSWLLVSQELGRGSWLLVSLELGRGSWLLVSLELGRGSWLLVSLELGRGSWLLGSLELGRGSWLLPSLELCWGSWLLPSLELGRGSWLLGSLELGRGCWAAWSWAGAAGQPGAGEGQLAAAQPAAGSFG
ncbi:hypothetical protein QJQ45_003949 [Haematococcus lacustris]|nr:hypothetical protein QJQ45_003949 [Haematococcus lacustris]